MAKPSLRQTPPVEAVDLTLERILSLQEASQVTSLSIDTLERRYGHLIVRLSPRRRGIKLRAALAITNGQAT